MVVNFATVVLAAGLGKRTGSKLPKVLIRSSEERPLISYVLETISEIKSSCLAIVVGYEKELVSDFVETELGSRGEKAVYCFQSEQRGTGDAVKSCREALKDWQGPILIVCGDMPLICPETLSNLLSSHESLKATLSLVTCQLSHDNGFGRIIRDSSGEIAAIVERKDCSPSELKVSERNLGIYCVDSSFLFSALERIENNNAQSEYYLTDIVKLAAAEGQRIVSVSSSDIEEALGVNDLSDLTLVNEALRKRRLLSLAKAGVKFLAPDSVIIDPKARIEPGVSIGPSVQIIGETVIGKDTRIEGSAVIRDSKIGSNCLIKLGAYITEATLEDSVTIGPFVNIRPGSKLETKVGIGNFVELKNAKLAAGVKANHLSYLGDCEIGENSNIGAGTITCNYDGIKKSRTTIGKNVFVGSNTSLVAPVVLGDGAVIGAGSVITKNVAADSLALTRAVLTAKEGWAKGRKKS